MKPSVAATYPLRWAHWWLAAGGALVALVAVLSLMPAPPEMGGSDKLAHLSAYASLALWFAGIYRSSRYAAILLGLLLFGVAIEILQGLGGSRQPEFADAAANLAGIVFGLALGKLGLGGWCARVERVLLPGVGDGG